MVLVELLRNLSQFSQSNYYRENVIEKLNLYKLHSHVPSEWATKRLPDRHIIEYLKLGFVEEFVDNGGLPKLHMRMANALGAGTAINLLKIMHLIAKELIYSDVIFKLPWIRLVYRLAVDPSCFGYEDLMVDLTKLCCKNKSLFREDAVFCQEVVLALGSILNPGLRNVRDDFLGKYLDCASILLKLDKYARCFGDVAAYRALYTLQYSCFLPSYDDLSIRCLEYLACHAYYSRTDFFLQNGTQLFAGLPNTSTTLSKQSLNALVRLLQNLFHDDHFKEGAPKMLIDLGSYVSELEEWARFRGVDVSSIEKLFHPFHESFDGYSSSSSSSTSGDVPFYEINRTPCLSSVLSGTPIRLNTPAKRKITMTKQQILDILCESDSSYEFEETPKIKRRKLDCGNAKTSDETTDDESSDETTEEYTDTEWLRGTAVLPAELEEGESEEGELEEGELEEGELEEGELGEGELEEGELEEDLEFSCIS